MSEYFSGVLADEFGKRIKEDFSPEKTAQEWAEEVKNRLSELFAVPEVLPESELLIKDTQVMNGLILQEAVLEVRGSISVPMWILTPRNTDPPGVILALHGHGPGRNDLINRAENEEDRNRIRELNCDYGLQAALKGYKVIIPDRPGFGKLADPSLDCRKVNSALMRIGSSLSALELKSNLVLAESICRTGTERSGFLCIGFSGGAHAALFLALFEPRIKAVVLSCQFGKWHYNRRFSEGCPCQTIPGILKIADRDAIAAALAPRPLLIQEGKDPDQGRKLSKNFEAACSHVRKAYTALHAENSFQVQLFKGGHQWNNDFVWDWLRQVFNH